MEHLTSALSQEKYGFVTDIEADEIPFGLNEEIVTLLSQKKEEPQWMLDFRLKAFRYWQKMTEPDWAAVTYPRIDFQALRYYSAPKQAKEKPQSLDEVDPELIKTFERLGIPLTEQKRLTGVAIDAVFDSVSVGTTHKGLLEKEGIIFCSMSEAISDHPDLVRKYLASVVPYTDNFYAA